MAKSAVAIAVEELADKLVGVDVTELPAVTSGDAGKVLTVNAEGKWVAAAIPSQLPTVDTDDNGKALLVSGGVWADGSIPSQLPAVSGTDEGKVLTVNSSGEWVAAALPQ